MGGSCLANMALYGGMMFTYSKDVKAKEAKECKKEETANGKNGGAGTPSGGTTSTEGGGPGGPGSSIGSNAAGGGAQAAAASPSAQAESTPTLAAVTVSTTSVACEGTSISSTETTDAKSIEVSYVGCASYSEKTSCMAVTGAMESSRSETNGGSTDIVAACMGAVSAIESGTSAGTICGGIAVYKSEESSSTDGTTAIVACATAAAEVSSMSKDGGTSRLVIQECVGVAMRKTKGKGLYIVARQNRRIAFSAPKSTKVKK